MDNSKSEKPSTVDFYDASGRQTHKLHRGLNIIRMSDGTARKVVVR